MQHTTYIVLLLSLFLLLPRPHLRAQDKPEMVLQMGHTSDIMSAAVSPNGLYVCSGGRDKVVKLWLLQTGQELRTYTHTENVRSVAFTPDSKWIVAADYAKEIKVWDVETGALVHNLVGHAEALQRVVVSPDGQLALSCGMYEIKLWDLKTGTCVRTITLPKLTKIPGSSSDYATEFETLAFSPDGKYIYAAGVEQVVKVWETTTGNFLRSFGPLADRSVQTIAISPNGQYVAQGTYRGLRMFDSSTGAEVAHMNHQGSDVEALVFSADGSTLLAGGDDLYLYEVATGKRLMDYKSSTDNYVLCLAQNGQSMILAEREKLKLHAITNGELLQTYQGTVRSTKASCLSVDGQYIVSGNADHSVSLWDAATGKRLKVFVDPTAAANAYITAVAISADNKRILSGSSQQKLYIWDVESGKLLAQKEDVRSDNTSQKWDIGSIAIAPDGKTALLGAWKEIVLWDIEANKRLHNFTGHGLGMIYSVAFSPDGKYFASACTDKSAKLWDLSTRKAIQTMGGTTDWREQFEAIAFSPDGRYAFGGSMSSDIRMWDLSDGLTHKIFSGHTGLVQSVAVSPDGTLLASASYDKTIRLWDIASGLPLRTLSGHLGNVFTVHFSRDGKHLISSSIDGTLRQWDVATGTEMVALTAFAGSANYLNFTPDGYYTASITALNQGVFYRVGMKLYSFDQFDLQYNRPDIVLQRLGRANPDLLIAYRKAWEKRLRKMGFNPANFEAQRSFNVPEISLAASTPTQATVKQALFTLAFTAQDKRFNLDRILLSVNGVPHFGVKGKSLLATKAKTTKQSIGLALSEGKNTIKLSVMNEKGVESLTETLNIDYQPDTPAKPNLYVVTIGVSKFAEADYNLNFADKDAKDLAALFASQTQRYGSINVFTLTNEEATKAKVLALKAQLAKSTVNDHVVVFLASHGLMDSELDYYLAMHNTSFANPKVGGLRYDELEGLLDGIPARNKLMLLDACHSGEVDKDESQLVAAETTQSNAAVTSRGFKRVVSKTTGIGLANSFELMKELFADLRRNNGSIVVSAAAGKEYAFESEQWHNGVFTYSLLEGVQSGNADSNKDQKISVSELRNYLSRRVQELTNGKQNPTSRAENLDNDFLLWSETK